MASKDNERAILDRPLHGLSLVGAEKKTLLTYSTRSDKIMLFISFVCAILGGILNPLISVIYGQTVGVFQKAISSSTPPPVSKTQHLLVTYTLYWVYLSIAIFVLIYIATVEFYYIGERNTRTLRREYLKSVIRQNIAYFDTHVNGENGNGQFRLIAIAERKALGAQRITHGPEIWHLFMRKRE